MAPEETATTIRALAAMVRAHTRPTLSARLEPIFSVVLYSSGR